MTVRPHPALLVLGLAAWVAAGWLAWHGEWLPLALLAGVLAAPFLVLALAAALSRPGPRGPDVKAPSPRTPPSPPP